MVAAASPEPFRPLAGIRVLDATTIRGEMAGRLLADLGAEVLKIEPPGGTEARRRAPFEAGREGDREASLYWAAVGMGKKSAVLDLDSDEGRGRVAELAAVADVFLESFDPGVTARLGLSWPTLAVRHPGLVYVSITPFGQSGPKALWPTTELTIEAAGGRVALQGDPDRPPLPMGFPHSWFHAGAQAAADVAIALNERAVSGLGQHLDLSAQEAMIWTLMGPYGYPVATGGDPPGAGDDRGDPAALTQLARLFPRLCECADGYVAVAMSPLGQSRGGGIIPTIMRELRGEGRLPPTLAAVDWDGWEDTFRSGELPEPIIEEAVACALERLRSRTKAELVEWTLANKLRLGAVRTTRDLLEDPHLAARRFFQEVAGRLHPGLPARVSSEPEPLPGPAPALGEHQHLVAEWCGRSARAAAPGWAPEGDAVPPGDRGTTGLPLPGPAAADAEELQQRHLPHVAGERKRFAFAQERLGEAFHGIRVADFAWVVAGPTISKALADHGATVVRVESAKRPDLARKLPPFKDEVDGLNRSQWAGMFNTSKRSLALDLGSPEGLAVARRLANWADVVIDSFSPGTMDRFGLGWGTLSAERDDLIMLSTSLFASGGPLTPYVGFGQQAAAMVGLHAPTGWPDRAPAGPYGPYTDVIAPKFGITALAAAILERRRTGRGRRIELAQAETGIRFIEPLFLDEAVNGRTATARGMDSDTACPHGVYATRGTERYVAIGVETAEHWRRLREVAPLAAFSDPALECLEHRLAARDRIEAAVGDWCRGVDARELEGLLVAAGVPASVVQRPTDLYADPQLEHRGFREVHEHAELGPMPYDAFATRFSAKRRMLHGPTPCLGEHTDEVLRDLLGYASEEIEALRAAGVLT
ncbi:MAG: CoA transferase [Thermoanaerobaculia bacterium]|nr:CoA transferase [Thermoanaerobaculia bacterium]